MTINYTDLISSSTVAKTALTLCLALALVLSITCRQTHMRAHTQNQDNKEEILAQVDLSATMKHIRAILSKELPDIVLLPNSPTHISAFRQSTASYWAKQESEATPAIIPQPKNALSLSTAMKLINRTFTDCITSTDPERRADVEGLFAIRSGGHSPISGAASVCNGVLIDMRSFDDVEISEDGKSVRIGVGARWGDVYSALEERGLAVVGGRNAEVGVGGLVLGGGGIQTTASATSHPDLGRALGGGSNNFGIVTHITMPAFPCANIWSGFLYMPSFQAPKVLSAFHVSVNKVLSADPDDAYDSRAAGPLCCFTYLQALGMQAIAVNLVHTNPLSPDDANVDKGASAWPKAWRTSPFASLFRFWSTCKLRSLNDATREMSKLNPSGRRQAFGTTTVANDLSTLRAAHQVYRDSIREIKRRRVKGMSWTLVLQPLLPQWAGLGEDNPLGFHSSKTMGSDASDANQARAEEPLAIVSFTVNWAEKEDDVLVQGLIRRAVERIEEAARGMGMAHRYKYLNYCDSWQNPFEAYGEGEHMWLREVAEKYDEHGLFQRGFAGGFKLRDNDASINSKEVLRVF
ncbi:FAD-binding domain-containing protein [Lophiostoma macrostomum CBS 122681]|uniref:FAD-binding domain-containing protein n=1 Tax=Lophiostoma macrostomum CBS 122681 TaxID=1314788 RepID=A0A6A6SVN4_9PLEO|nr:FAD-binding domain-containing protein [Lophiostoma macrostomum CBS 122681]